MTSQTTIALCAVVVSILAFAVSIASIIFNWHQKRLDNLLSLHQFLHQPGLSEARRSIREGDCDITLRNPNVLHVCSAFDFAGTIVRNKVVSKRLFLGYWAIPLKALETPLNKIALDPTGKVANVKSYYKDCWWLFERADEFIQKHRSEWSGLQLK